MASAPSPAELPAVGAKAKVVIAVALAVAVGMLVLGGIYSGVGNDTGPILSGGPVDGGGDRNQTDGEPTELDIDPIETFLPTTGEGSTCTEAVGVDLIPGFSAILTINGVEIPEDQLNGFGVNSAGVRVQSAGSSLGQFTWGPEEGCPQGPILRPQDNRLEACIYRNVDGPDSCRVYVHTFDAL